MGGQNRVGAETHTYSAESFWLNRNAVLGGKLFRGPPCLPRAAITAVLAVAKAGAGKPVNFFGGQ